LVLNAATNPNRSIRCWRCRCGLRLWDNAVKRDSGRQRRQDRADLYVVAAGSPAAFSVRTLWRTRSAGRARRVDPISAGLCSVLKSTPSMVAWRRLIGPEFGSVCVRRAVRDFRYTADLLHEFQNLRNVDLCALHGASGK
jgi:hypothetical protein